MPVNPRNCNHRGGGNYGVVLRCPRLVSDRLVYFDYNAERESWVIRDFVEGQRLDDNHSTLTVAEIKNDADHDEFPPWWNAEENPADWTTYLKLRTTAALKVKKVPAGPPNPRSGDWQPL